MALKMALSDSDIGAAFPEAYIRIATGRTVKDRASMQVDYYADEAARIAEKTLVQQRFYDVEIAALDIQAGEHPHAPYYRHLKTLPEFAGAIDV